MFSDLNSHSWSICFYSGSWSAVLKPSIEGKEREKPSTRFFDWIPLQIR